MYRERETERTENNVETLVSFNLRFSYFTKFLRSNKPDAAGSAASASNIGECSATDCNVELNGASHVINNEVPNGECSCVFGA